MKRARFKVGQVVVGARTLPGLLNEGELLRIGWKEFRGGEWIYRTARWASMGYEEKNLRPLNKREIGAEGVSR